MHITELKKVIEIDNHISRLHQELAGLYHERQQYIGLTADAPLRSDSGAKTNTASENWATHTHEYLFESWKKYGIKVPSFRLLKNGLSAAQDTIKQLSVNQPELQNKLGVLLVPPVHILGKPGECEHRKLQQFATLNDYIETSMPHRFQQKKWNLFVVYQHPVPLNFGSALQILTDRKYIINGHDMRGLGLYEYYALSLQSSMPLDAETWTLLLKGLNAKSRTAPSVTFNNGHYRFETDDCDSVFGDQRFRPAVKIASI